MKNSYKTLVRKSQGKT